MKIGIQLGRAFLFTLVFASAGFAAPLGTGFTYQGRLNQNNVPFTGAANLQFSLWDAPGSGTPPAGGTRIGAFQKVTNVAVANGLFTVTLNAGGEFSAQAFTGNARWLQIEVCTNANCTTTTILGPRQPLTATPYALHALDEDASNWIDKGNDVVLPTGNAGIGTSTPSALLHLRRDFAEAGLRIQTARYEQGTSANQTKSPASVVVSGASQPWTSPNSVKVSDDVRATVSLSAITGTPDALEAQAMDLTNWGFSVPVGGTVVGISVQVEGQGTCACQCDSCLVGGTAQLLGNPAAGQNSGFTFGTSDTTSTLGSAVDLWSQSWTPQQVNASGFGVRINAKLDLRTLVFCIPSFGCVYDTCDCPGSGVAALDAVTVTVYYYDAPVNSFPVDWSIGIPQGSTELVVSASSSLNSPILSINPAGRVGINAVAPVPFNLVVNGFAAKPGGGSWSQFSDARLKENIRPMQGTLDKLLMLHGYEFEYTPAAVETKLGLPGRQQGLLAQDVQQVFPDWVGQSEDGYLFVTERSTTALVVEALRDLREEKDHQLAAVRAEKDAQINELRCELRELKEQVEHLAVERR